MPGRDWRVFRYPFLQEGATESAREAVRAHLFEKGYRIARGDGRLRGLAVVPALRALRGRERRARDLERAARALPRAPRATELLDADALARELFGRPIRQILLLHAGAFTAEMIEDLLAEYEALGVRFISLDDALEDPAYHLDPRFARELGQPVPATRCESALQRRRPDVEVAAARRDRRALSLVGTR